MRWLFPLFLEWDLRACYALGGICWLRDGGYSTTVTGGTWHEAEELRRSQLLLAEVEVPDLGLRACDECHCQHTSIQLKR